MEEHDGTLSWRGGMFWSGKAMAPPLHPPLSQGHWSNSWELLSSIPSQTGSK
ncbi:hypothetical protein LEMLEM_LOCUS5913, partial [Lemmus lemmus]